MRAIYVILFVLALPTLALAEGADVDSPHLQMSWSVYGQVDTLVVTNSGWTHCYLWLDPSPLQMEMVGFWGTLFRTEGVEAHRWRYMGTEAGDDIAIDPGAEEHRLGYLDVPCEGGIGSKVLFEFDVYIDVDQLVDSGSRPSSIGLVQAGASEWDPMIFSRNDIAEPCGYRSLGFAAIPNRLIVRQEPVAVQSSSFGTLKAVYR